MSKTPDGIKMKRKLPFKLGDEEKARKGEIAAQYAKMLEEAEVKKKSAMAIHNEKIKELKLKRDEHLTMINLGVEQREVNCTEVKNFESNQIEWWYGDQVIDSREMKAEDRQQTLEEGSKEKKPRNWQKLSTKRPKDGPMMPLAEENEIAQVHKLETSRKGASSAVDPK